MKHAMIILSLMLFSCRAQYSKNDKLDASKMGEMKPYIEVMVAGIEGGGRTTTLVFPASLVADRTDAVDVVEIRFRESVAYKTYRHAQRGMLSAQLKPKDLVMSGDSAEEFGNELPKELRSKTKLEPDEVLIRYRQNGSPAIHELILENVDVKPAQYLPGVGK
jgi:hypothetical protein